jgi:hypothetical protein
MFLTFCDQQIVLTTINLDDLVHGVVKLKMTKSERASAVVQAGGDKGGPNSA